MDYNDQMSHFQGCNSEASVPMMLEINYDGQPPPVHSNTQSCAPQPANSVSSSSSMTHAEISPALSPFLSHLRNQPSSQMPSNLQQPSEMPRPPPQPVVNYADPMSQYQGEYNNNTNYKKASVPMLPEINYQPLPPVHSNTESYLPQRANSVSSNMTAEISPTPPSHVRIHPSSQQCQQEPVSQPQDPLAQILLRREEEKRQRKTTSPVPVFKEPVKFDYQDRTATRIKALLPQRKIKNKASCEIISDNVENLEHCTIKRGIKDPLIFKEEVPYRITESISENIAPKQIISTSEEKSAGEIAYKRRKFKEIEDSLTHGVSSDVKKITDVIMIKKKIDKSCATFNDRHSTHSSGKIPKPQQEKKADASTKNIRKGKADIETHAIDSQNSEKYQSFLPSAPSLEESSQVKRKLTKTISSSRKHDNELISLQLSTSSFMSEDSNTSNIKNPTTAKKSPSDLAIATPRNLSSPLHISDSDFLTNCPLVSISPDISYNISVSDNTDGMPEDSVTESVISKVNKLKKSKDASVHVILSDIQKVTDVNVVKSNLNHSGKEIDKTNFSKIKNIAKVLPKSTLNDTHSTHSPAKKTRPQQEEQVGVSSKNLGKTKTDMETYNAAKDSHRSKKVENVPSCVLFSKESSQLKRKTKKSKCSSTEHVKLFLSPPTPVMSNHSISSNMKNPLRAEKNPSLDPIIKSSVQESDSQLKKHKKSICPSVNASPVNLYNNTEDIPDESAVPIFSPTVDIVSASNAEIQLCTHSSTKFDENFRTFSNNIDCSLELQQLDMLANKSEFSMYQNCELVTAKCDNEKHSYPDLLTVNNDEGLNINVNPITKLSNTSMFNDNIDAKSLTSSSEEVKVGEKNSKRTKNRELEHPSINSHLKLFESPPSPLTCLNSVTPKIKHPMRTKISTSLYPVIGSSIQESDSQQQKHEKDYLQPEMIIQDISFINKTFPESSYGTNNSSVTKPTDISPDMFVSDNAVGIAEECALPTISSGVCTSSPTSDIVFVSNAEMLLNTVPSIMCDPNVSAFVNPSELRYSGMLSNKVEPTTSHSSELDVAVCDDEKYSSPDLFTANSDKILNINVDLSTKSSNTTMFRDDIAAKSVISINEDVSRGEINSKICKFKELKDAASVQVILHDFQKVTDVNVVKENSIEFYENHLKKEVDKTDFSTGKIFAKELSVSPKSTSNNAFYGINSSHSTKKRTKPHQEKHAATVIKKLTKRQTDESHKAVTKSQTLGKSRSDHLSKESSIVKRKSRKSKSSTRELDTHKKSFESLPSSFGSINSLPSKIKNHMRTIKPSSLDLVIGNSVQESDYEQQKGKKNVQQETSIQAASCVNLSSSLLISDSSNLTDTSPINVQTNVSSNMSVSDSTAGISEDHKVILSDCQKINYMNTVKENIDENCEKPSQKEKDIKGISLIKNFPIAKNLKVILEPFPYKWHSSYDIQTSISAGQDSKLQQKKQDSTSNTNSNERKADIETHNVICDSQSSEKCEKGPLSANSSKKSPLIRRKNKRSKPNCREHENQWKSFEPKPSSSVSVNSTALKRYNRTRSRRLFSMDPVTGNSVQESNSLQVKHKNDSASKSSIVNVSNNKVTKEAQHIPLEVSENVLHGKPDVKDSCKLCQPRQKGVHVKKKKNMIKNSKTGNKIKLGALFSALPSKSGVLLKISSGSFLNFKCPKCRKLFTNLKTGSSHLISCRAKFKKNALIAYNKAIYVCTACDYNSTVKSNLINHRDTCMPNYIKDTFLNCDNTKKKQFMCSKCKFLFSSHQMYSIHNCAERLEEMKTCTVNLEIVKPSEFNRTIAMPNSIEHETPDNVCATESTVMKAQMFNETSKACVPRGKEDFVQNAEKCQTVDDMRKNILNPVSELSAELDSENPLPEFSLDVTMPYENQKLVSEAAQIYLSKTGLHTYGKLYKISPVDNDDDLNPDPQVQEVVNQLQNYKCNCKSKASYQKGEEKPCLSCLNIFMNECLTGLLNQNDLPSTSDASTSQRSHSNLQQEVNVQAASFVNSPSNNLKNNSSPAKIPTDTSSGSDTSGSDSTSVIPKEQVMATISTSTESVTIQKGDFTFIFSQIECALSSAEVKMTVCTLSRDLRIDLHTEYFQDVLIDLLAKLKKTVSLTNDFETALNIISQYNLTYVDIDYKSVHLYIHRLFEEGIEYCAYILKESNQYFCADCEGNFSSSYLIEHILQEHKENNIHISIIN